MAQAAGAEEASSSSTKTAPVTRSWLGLMETGLTRPWPGAGTGPYTAPHTWAAQRDTAECFESTKMAAGIRSCITSAERQLTVTLTVTDIHGDTNYCTASVIVLDTTPPNITCSSNITVEFATETGAAVSYTVSASDNCDPSPVITSAPPSGSVFT